MKKCNGMPVGVKRYLEKVFNHTKLKNVKLDFLMLYKKFERERRRESAEQVENEKIGIRIEELTSAQLAEGSQKRHYEVTWV